ncbi:MAG: antitermination protein NusG [Planctomycetes bacterium]|nr:antitermination protein NusG [Planctomycetota bacterium]
MPILVREVDLYPEDLLDRPELGHEEGASWWALYCLSRREKQLMRRLQALDVPFYGPLVAKPCSRGRISHVPLFDSYVFVYGDESHRYAALTTNCVSRSLAVPDSASLTSELRQVHRLIDSGEPLTPEPRLEPGSQVRILSGPLLGLEGVVIRRTEQTKLLVGVTLLGLGVSTPLDDCEVERID